MKPTRMFTFYSISKLMLYAISILFCIQITAAVGRTFVNPITNLLLYDLCKKIGITMDENRSTFGELVNGPTRITKTGPYVVGMDVVGPIIIAADNVTLDLNGWVVILDPTNIAAIWVEDDKENIIIKNGTIDRGIASGAGIKVGKATTNVNINNIIISGAFDSAQGYGIEVGSNTFGCNINNCIVNGGDTGIFFDGEDGEITNCNINSCNIQETKQYGICLSHVNDSQIKNTCVTEIYSSTKNVGLLISSSNSNLLLNNIISKIGLDGTTSAMGISLEESANNVIQGCQIGGIGFEQCDSATGIFVAGQGNLTIDNIIQFIHGGSSESKAIWIKDNNNTCVGNNIIDTGEATSQDSIGIFLESANNSIILQNIIQGCKGVNNIGIYIDPASRKCQIDKNTIQDYATSAIKDESPDGSPVITSNKVYNCGGGNPFSSNTAIYTQDLLLGAPNPYDNLYLSV